MTLCTYVSALAFAPPSRVGSVLEFHVRPLEAQTINYLHFSCFFHGSQLLLLVALALLQLEPRLVLNLSYLMVGCESFRLKPSHGLTCSGGSGGSSCHEGAHKCNRCCCHNPSHLRARRNLQLSRLALKATATSCSSMFFFISRFMLSGSFRFHDAVRQATFSCLPKHLGQLLALRPHVFFHEHHSLLHTRLRCHATPSRRSSTRPFLRRHLATHLESRGRSDHRGDGRATLP